MTIKRSVMATVNVLAWIIWAALCLLCPQCFSKTCVNPQRRVAPEMSQRGCNQPGRTRNTRRINGFCGLLTATDMEISGPYAAVRLPAPPLLDTSLRVRQRLADLVELVPT